MSVSLTSLNNFEIKTHSSEITISAFRDHRWAKKYSSADIFLSCEEMTTFLSSVCELTFIVAFGTGKQSYFVEKSSEIFMNKAARYRQSVSQICNNCRVGWSLGWDRCGLCCAHCIYYVISTRRFNQCAAIVVFLTHWYRQSTTPFCWEVCPLLSRVARPAHFYLNPLSGEWCAYRLFLLPHVKAAYPRVWPTRGLFSLRCVRALPI